MKKSYRIILRNLLILFCLLFVFSGMSYGASGKRQQAEDLTEHGKQAEINQQYDSATMFYNMAVKADPTYDIPHQNLGELYYRSGNKKESIAEFRKAVDLNPTNYNYQMRLAVLYKEEKLYRDAVNSWNEALKISSEDPRILYNLGETYFLLEDYPRALDNYDKFISMLDSQNNWRTDRKLKNMYWSSHRDMAEIYTRQKNFDRAIHHYRYIIDNCDEDNFKMPAEQALRNLNQEKNKKTYIMVGGVVGVFALVVIMFFWKFLLHPANRGSGVGEDVSFSAGDAKTYAALGRYAASQFRFSTEIPDLMVYFVEREGEPLILADYDASKSLYPRELEVKWTSLARWLNTNQGKPFLYQDEKREISFAKAVPNWRDSLDPFGPQIGIVFIHNGYFLGLAFLCDTQMNDRKKIKAIYKKAYPLIEKMTLEISQSAEKIYRRESAKIDPVTPTYNHLFFRDKLPEEISKVREKSRCLALVMFECDGMGAILKRFGEDKRNFVLKSLVQSMKNKFASQEIYYFRIAENRFALIMPGLNISKAAQAAETIRNYISGVRFPRPIPNIRASMGLAVFPDHADDSKGLEKIAHNALEKAIITGRNRLVVDTEIYVPETPKGPPAADESGFGGMTVPLGAESQRTKNLSMAMGTQMLDLDAEKSPGMPSPTFRVADKKVPAVPRTTKLTTYDIADMVTPEPQVIKIPKAFPGQVVERKEGKDFFDEKSDIRAHIEKTPMAWMREAEEEARKSGSLVKPSGSRILDFRETGLSTSELLQAKAAKSQETGIRTHMEGSRQKSSEASLPERSTLQGGGLRRQGEQLAKLGGEFGGPPSASTPKARLEKENKIRLGDESSPSVVSRLSSIVPSSPFQEVKKQSPLGDRVERSVKESVSGADLSVSKTSATVQDEKVTSLRRRQSGGASTGAKDSVTGFYFKTYCEQSISKSMRDADAKQVQFSLIFFKLDKHKELKAKYGLDAFNQALREISSRIMDLIRKGVDVPARYSDEIFVIVLPDNNSQNAFNLAEQIRSSLADMKFNKIPVKFTVSLGIASYPDKASSERDIMKKSYEAMVQSIKSGGNRSLIWEESQKRS